MVEQCIPPTRYVKHPRAGSVAAPLIAHFFVLFIHTRIQTMAAHFLYSVQPRCSVTPLTLCLDKNKTHQQTNKQPKDKETHNSLRLPHCRPRVGLPHVSCRPGGQPSYRPSVVDQKVVTPLPSTISAFHTPLPQHRLRSAVVQPFSFSSLFGFSVLAVGLLVRTLVAQRRSNCVSGMYQRRGWRPV